MPITYIKTLINILLLQNILVKDGIIVKSGAWASYLTIIRGWDRFYCNASSL